MDPFRIEKITVQGWKSLRDVSPTLGPVTVLIGRNGTGKSNLLSALRILRSAAEGQISLGQDWARKGGSRDLLWRGPKRTSQVKFRIAWPRNSDSIVIMPTDDGLGAFAYNLAGHSREVSGSTVSLVLGSKKQKLGSIRPSLSKPLKQIALYHLNDTSPSSRLRGRSFVDQVSQFSEDGGNLAAFLYHLERTQPAHFRAIEDSIRRTIPGFGRFVLEPIAGLPNEISLQWRSPDGEHDFSVNQLSDGSLRWIGIWTLLLQPREWLPAVILIDEPELGLHPELIEVFVGLLRQASETVQVIAATQSPYLLNSFEPDEVVTVDHDGEQSAFGRHDADSMREWLEEFTMGELWEKNVIGGRLLT